MSISTRESSSGSAACVTAPEPWMDGLVDFILDASVAGVPLLGICFGHQIIAHAIYGPGSVRKSATPEIGWTDIRVTSEDPLFAGLEGGFNTFESHFDEVVPAEGMTVFASSERCAVQAYRVADKPIWGAVPCGNDQGGGHRPGDTSNHRSTGSGHRLDAKLAEAKDSASGEPIDRELGPQQIGLFSDGYRAGSVCPTPAPAKGERWSGVLTVKDAGADCRQVDLGAVRLTESRLKCDSAVGRWSDALRTGPPRADRRTVGPRASGVA